jgi:hypothetical protein
MEDGLVAANHITADSDVAPGIKICATRLVVNLRFAHRTLRQELTRMIKTKRPLFVTRIIALTPEDGEITSARSWHTHNAESDDVILPETGRRWKLTCGELDRTMTSTPLSAEVTMKDLASQTELTQPSPLQTADG